MNKDNANEINDLLSLMFRAHPWHGVSAGVDAPDLVTSFVEIVPGDTIKYELDKPTGLLRIDRPLVYSSLCPMPYGFIPQTYCGDSIAEFCRKQTGLPIEAGDGDPIDICILTEKIFTHGNILVNAKPIGGLRMVDHLEADDKIIAVLTNDSAFGHFNDISECPQGLIDRLRHYFLSYKQLPTDESPRQVEITHIYNREEAHEVINHSVFDYQTKFGKPEDRFGELQRLLKN
ncbi:MAG: inorganic pyrophosphatase [Pyrinomonadaceae bacterium]|nr:inorganic pyrophosphatase [Pyrinomonadaceae bacterium]